MFSTKGPTLWALTRRLIFSFSLIIFGSWGLLFPRLGLLFPNLDISWGQFFFRDPQNRYYYDLGCLGLIFGGLILVLYYRARLKPRLKRVEDLGEGSW